MKKNLRSNELQKAKQVSGNVLTELNEAELGREKEFMKKQRQLTQN